MATSKKAKPSYLYAIIGITLVLFLLGLLGWMAINGRSLSRTFKEDVTLQVDFHDNTREENIQKMNDILKAQPFVKQAKVISKEEALKMQSEIEGEDIGAFLGYNPLFASIEVNLKADYVNKDSLAKIDAFIRQSNIVREVNYPTTIVEKMNSNFRKAGIFMGILSLVLLGVVIVLIDNTVRLAMFADRFTIKTMQMVGATRAFISKPFNKRAVINGLISGVIAIICLYGFIALAESWMPDLKALQNNFLLGILMLLLLILGVVISFVSTQRSVVKYLKLRLDDLY